MRTTTASLRARFMRANFQDAGYGYDAFGMNPDWVARTLSVSRWFHDHWFRVTPHGIENIPGEGGAILASNHSGSLPLDGVMIVTNVALSSEPVRIPRPVADHFVPRLPFISKFFARVGVFSGTRANVRHVLERGGLLLIFPEGTPGIGKPFAQRYQLQGWRIGHAELAIRQSAPIIPTAVIGAEEQMPQIARLPIRAFGSPWLPISFPPFPLPVHYHIHYGEPIDIGGLYRPEHADDLAAVDEAAARVKVAVEGLIAKGLEQREGVFR